MMVKVVVVIMIEDDDNDYKGNDKNDNTDLNYMIINPDASVTAGNRVFDNPLHIDVQLICNNIELNF